MKLAEEKKVVLVASELNFTTDQTTKGINMKGYHHATFLIEFGTIGTDDVNVKAYSGTDDLSLTSAIAFRYAYSATTCLQGTIASGADVLSAEATVVAADGLVVAQSTKSNFMLIVEVDASDMDLDNEEEWLSLKFTDTGSATGMATVFAILEPRYTSNRSATALA